MKTSSNKDIGDFKQQLQNEMPELVHFMNNVSINLPDHLTETPSLPKSKLGHWLASPSKQLPDFLTTFPLITGLPTLLLLCTFGLQFFLFH